jgi:hypothetical protein
MTTTTKTHRLVVRGREIKTRTERRYVVVAVRPKPTATEAGTFVAFARVEKRTDSIETARTVARRYGFANGAFAVVIDTTTGGEIDAPAPAPTTGPTLARALKTGEWISYRGERVERVVRVTAGPRGYVHVRTDKCDRTVKSETPVERVPAPEWARRNEREAAAHRTAMRFRARDEIGKLADAAFIDGNKALADAYTAAAIHLDETTL